MTEKQTIIKPSASFHSNVMSELKKQTAQVNLNRQFLSNPKFQSTQLEQTSLNEYTLYFPPASLNKVSSTMISDSLITNDLSESQILVEQPDSTHLTVSSSNDLYFTPASKQNNSIVSESSSSSSSYCSVQEFTQYQSFSCDSNDFQTIKSSFFEQSSFDDNENELFVCCIPYEPMIQGDLNLKYADRVKLIHANSDYCLVQNIISKQCGYVPSNCITLLNNFLNQA
jgi:hypothetical protein